MTAPWRHALITVAQMRALDARAAELGVPTRTLMENAGAAVAEAVAKRFAPCRVAVACGPGANGGDGYVAARRLAALGFDVFVEALVMPSALTGDAASAAAAWTGPTLPLDGTARQRDLTIDALFGAGLSRPLEGAAAAAALAMAQNPARVVAIDVPSGVAGDGAAPQGPRARAGLTVTFLAKKPAHVLQPSAAACGEVLVAEIGAPEEAWGAVALQTWENYPDLWRQRLPWPGQATHKHQRGKLAIWAEGEGATSLLFGAQRLTARAAQRAGAGWVNVFVPDGAERAFTTEPAALVVRRAVMGDVGGHAAIVFGPGAGRGAKTRATAIELAKRAPALVLDADALSSFEGVGEALFAALPQETVLTPHKAEFKRLFPTAAAAPDKLSAARQAAAASGAVVLFKGADTVIAAPDGRAIINTHASPFLATAGTGDVLAGLIGALMAQGLPAFEAAAAGAWIHGEASLRHGPGLIADDLIGLIPPVLSALAPLASAAGDG